MIKANKGDSKRFFHQEIKDLRKYKHIQKRRKDFNMTCSTFNFITQGISIMLTYHQKQLPREVLQKRCFLETLRNFAFAKVSYQ